MMTYSLDVVLVCIFYAIITCITKPKIFKFICTRCVQKVSRILYFFKSFLFIHEYLSRPLQSNPHQILYTCAKFFFPILEALQKIIFCDLIQLLLRCRLYLLNRSVASSFHGPLQFRKQL